MDKEAQAITDATPSIRPVTDEMVERAAVAIYAADPEYSADNGGIDPLSWSGASEATRRDCISLSKYILDAIAQDLINLGLRDAVAVCDEVEREIDNETGLLHSVEAALTGISWARRCAQAITARIEEKEDD